MPQRRLHGQSASRPYVPAKGLDRIDCTTLSEAVYRLAPGWSAEAHRDPHGRLSLMIIPPNADDALGPTLIVRRTRAALCVDQFQWDDYSPIGAYRSIDAVLETLHHLLHALPRIAGGSTMLH
jgi:hypothetical protein